MNVLDLFSGIGGFSLGLERAGMKTIAFCEIEEFPRKVLRKHWPNVPIFKDIKKLHATDITETVDLICGGWPCQPFSVAGKQRGRDDDRDLWPEVFRLVQEIRPTWIIGENVAGFVNMELERTFSDLESEGYEVEAFIIPACAINAPHRRDRVWIVAYNGRKRAECKSEMDENQKGWPEFGAESCRKDCIAADNQILHDWRYIGEQKERQIPESGNRVEQSITPNTGLRRQERTEQQTAGGEQYNQEPFAYPSGPGCEELDTPCLSARQGHSAGRINQNIDDANPECRINTFWRNHSRDGWEWQSPSWDEHGWIEVASKLCRMDDGISQGMDSIGRISSKSTKKKKAGRNHRLKALGNAVVPQIPEIIGRAIMDIEKDNLSVRLDDDRLKAKTTP